MLHTFPFPSTKVCLSIAAEATGPIGCREDILMKNNLVWSISSMLDEPDKLLHKDKIISGEAASVLSFWFSS